MPQRRVRKTEPPAFAQLEEQFWPVIVSIFVLAGFLAGTVLAYLPFEADSPLRAAPTWLFVIAIVACLAIWGLRYISPRSVRRSLQLSVVLCLMLHVALFLVSMRARIFGRLLTDERPATAVVPPPSRPRIVVPSYSSVQFTEQDQRKRELFRPVREKEPLPTRSELAAAADQESPASTRLQPLPVPEITRSPEPREVRRATPMETSPRRNERAALLSRQPVAMPPRPNQPIARPTVAESASPSSSPLSPRESPTAPLAGEKPAQPLAASELEPRKTPAVSADSHQRAGESKSPSIPSSSSAAALRKPLDSASRVPRSEVDNADTPAVAQSPESKKLTPQAVRGEKQLTQGPREPRTDRAPDPDVVPLHTPRVARREQRSPRQPQLAETLESTADRNRRLTTRTETTTGLGRREAGGLAASTTAALADAPTAPPASRPSGVAPAPSSLARNETATNAAGATGLRSAEAASRPSSVLESPAAKRTPVADMPTLNPAASPGPRPSRATAVAQIEASPKNVESPTAGQTAEGASARNDEPGRWALARSTQGKAGLGHSTNLDRAAPAADSPSLQASGSARRKQSIQNLPEGPSLAPSQVSTTRRSLAAGDAPGSSVQVTSPDGATLAADERPSQVTARSSASLARLNSNAEPASTTAAQGVIDIDLGPTQILSERGQGRASGGGQPQLNSQTDAPVEAKRRPGGDPQVSISAVAAAVEPAAPRGEGGGRPATSVDPSSQELPRLTADQATGDSGGGSAPRLESSASGLARSQPANGGLAAGAGLRSTPETIGEATGPITMGRAETADAAEGRIVPGGGLASSTRSIRGPLLSPDARAEVPTMAGSERDGGHSRGVTLSSEGSELERQTTGSATAPAASEPGAVASDRTLNSLADGQRESGTRRDRNQDAPSPQMAGGGPRGDSKSTPTGTGPSINTLAQEVLSPSDSLVAVANPGGPASAEPGRLSENAAASLRVELPVDPGPGGMGDRVDADLGLNDRRAVRDSLQVSSRGARFIRPEFGGPQDSNPAAATPAEPFRRRTQRVASGAPATTSPEMPGPQTEEAIELGLDFLARYQQPNGSWSLQGLNESTAFVSDTAATGLALLAFQGAGYTHREHRYAPLLAAGLQYLIDNQKDDGDLFLSQDEDSNRSVWLYSHSIAALALCEAYGMTRDENLRQHAQESINFIAKAQDATYGGWRYIPGSGADTSVTGWMMMALKSGELAGLKVPRPTYELARRWLDSAQQSEGQPHLYRYNPFAPDTATQRHGRNATPTMTSVGLLMRLYDGWRRDRESMIQGAQYLLENPPALGNATNPKRDTYYWYYGTQVMFHMGGRYWAQWNERLHPLLINSQVKEGTMAGSWDPRKPVPDRWGAQAGRIYLTTLNLLSLEVYYRHLPLYESTAQ